MKKFIIPIAVSGLFFLVTAAQAEVRFGHNVRVSGHDFSNRTFSSKKNAKIYLYDKKPKNEGCRWIKKRDSNGNLTGRKTQICHLQKKMNPNV